MVEAHALLGVSDHGFESRFLLPAAACELEMFHPRHAIYISLAWELYSPSGLMHACILVHEAIYIGCMHACLQLYVGHACSYIFLSIYLYMVHACMHGARPARGGECMHAARSYI